MNGHGRNQAEGGAPATQAARLASGQMTLAEFAGLPREELYAIASVGHRLLCGGKLDEARTIYRGLVAADPYDSVFRCHLAATYLRLGESDMAIEEFTAALRFNVANVDALAGRGEAHLSRGELVEAVRDLSAAVELDPGVRRASTARARTLLRALKESAARHNAAST